MNVLPQPEAEAVRHRFAQLLHMEFCPYGPELPADHLQKRARMAQTLFGSKPPSARTEAEVGEMALPPFAPSVSDTARLLPALAARTETGEMDNDARAWIDFFQQRFEVSKALFARYPAPQGERELLLDARPYACLALALLREFMHSGRHASLSTALKVLDLLTLSDEIIGREQCAQLRTALEWEQTLVGEAHGD